MKIKFLFLSAFLLFLFSCKKTEQKAPLPASQAYLTVSGGSTWNYNQIDSSGSTPAISNYTLTSTSKDSTINGRIYHIYSNSAGGNQYLNETGTDYYQFDSLPAGIGSGAFERLYLRDSAYAGTSWSQTQTVTITGVPFNVPVTISYNIAARDITLTVNNITYTNVIQVTSSISSSLIPSADLTSSINSYYAPKVGLIQSSTKINLNYSGIVENVNLTVRLVSSTIL